MGVCRKKKRGEGRFSYQAYSKKTPRKAGKLLPTEGEKKKVDWEGDFSKLRGSGLRNLPREGLKVLVGE